MDTPTDNPLIPTPSDRPLYRNRFPVVWQLGILLLLLGGLFTSGVVTWLHTSTDDTAWVERTAVPHPTSLLTTHTPSLDGLALTAEHVFVYDLMANRVMYQKDADTVAPLASITKLMTAVVAHELLESHTTTRVPINAVRQQSASGLLAGEQMKVDDLTNYALLASSNDAAYLSRHSRAVSSEF